MIGREECNRLSDVALSALESALFYFALQGLFVYFIISCTLFRNRKEFFILVEQNKV